MSDDDLGVGAVGGCGGGSVGTGGGGLIFVGQGQGNRIEKKLTSVYPQVSKRERKGKKKKRHRDAKQTLIFSTTTKRR